MAALIGTRPGRDYTGASASNVPVQSDLFLLFSGSVAGSVGSVEIHKVDAHGDLVEGTSGSQAVISTPLYPSANGTYTEAQISVPGGTLDPGTQYYVSIDGNAFYDTDSQGYVSPAFFTFTTAPSRPTLTGLTGSPSYAQGGAPVALAPNALFADADFASGSVTVSGLGSGDQVTLPDGTASGLTFASGAINKSGAPVGSYSQSGGTFTATLTTGTAADAQTIVDRLAFSNAATTPAASRNLTVAVTDQFGRVTVDPSSASFAAGTVPSGSSTGSIALADLDQDGLVDLFSQSGDFQYNSNQGSRGNPTFSLTSSAVYSQSNLTYPASDLSFALADLDADGLPDLLVRQGGSSISFARNVSVPADATGPTPPAPQFESPPTGLTFTGTAPSGLTGFAFGDLTGDARLDLVALSGADLTLFVNSGSTSNLDFTSTNSNPFAAINTYNETIGSSATVALGDINGDGKLDLVVGEANGSIVGFLDQGTVIAHEVGLPFRPARRSAGLAA